MEKFVEKEKFGLWQVKVQDLLVQQGLQKALKGKSKKPKTIKDGDQDD